MALDGSRAWTRPLVRAFRPSLQKGGGLRPLLGVGSRKHLRVGNAVRLPVGKNCHPRRGAKNANADRMVALHAQIYFTAWVACAREMKAPTFLVAINRCQE
jgi:hypothetical protein